LAEDQAMKVTARTVDFLVCPATFREIREKRRLPSARINCVQ
jgi:hypothetical protein